MKLNEQKPNNDSSISSLYSKEKLNKSNYNENNNKNMMNVGHSDTQPSNESSVEISTYSEVMQQFKIKNKNNQNENETEKDKNTNNQNE